MTKQFKELPPHRKVGGLLLEMPSLFRKELVETFFESLILAQDERWRRVLGMQVERSRVAIYVIVANGCVTHW